MKRYSGPPVPLPAPLEARVALLSEQLSQLMEKQDVHKPVKDLAGTVNAAVNALSGVSDVAAALQAAAVKVSGRVQQVQGLTNDLLAADAALALAVDGAAAQEASNGGPPLADASTSSVSPPSPTSPPAADMTIKQSLKTVEAANS